jgi:acyl-CoA thioester hydrolase
MILAPPIHAYELRIAVAAEDIDQLGHVNNVVYLCWVQEIATAHWYATAMPEDQERLLWMVLRHEIDYKRSARLGDQVIARTWVGQATRRAFERHTEFRRGADSKLLAKALTLWCPVDRQSLQPTDVGASVRERFAIPDAGSSCRSQTPTG